MMSIQTEQRRKPKMAAKGSFALNRESFADIGLSIRLPEKLRNLVKNENPRESALSAAPEIIFALERYGKTAGKYEFCPQEEKYLKNGVE